MAWTAPSAWEIWDPEQYVLCPFDISHRIKCSRFQRHLVRCRKNHPDKDFVSCPFNASHQVLRPHLRNHICSCPDKDVVEVAVNAYGKDDESYHLKGDTSVPSYHSTNHEEPEEDWDQELGEDSPPVRRENPVSTAVRTSAPYNFAQGSLLCQNRAQMIREVKLQALADDINQRWFEDSSHQTTSGEVDESWDSDTSSTSHSQRFSDMSKTCRQDSEYGKQSPLHLAGIGRGKLVSDAYVKKFGGYCDKTTFR